MTQRVDPPVPGYDQTPEQFWENLYTRFRENRDVWGARANPRLVEVAELLPPGRALDVGCGSGGDALWLARRGWQVTAVDISETAVRQVAHVANEAGVGDAVTTQRHDLTQSFPDGSFDLISAQYFHTPFDMDRAAVLRTAAHALKPGGRLLIVDHASIAPWSWNQDRDTHFPAPQEMYDEIGLPPATWSLERGDKPTREARGPDGQTATVTDCIVLIRRTSR